MAQTKPTAGAIRAAEILYDNGHLHPKKLYRGYINEIAQLIDQQTGLAELLEYLKLAEDALTEYDVKQFDTVTQFTSEIRAAIARAEKGA